MHETALWTLALPSVACCGGEKRGCILYFIILLARVRAILCQHRGMQVQIFPWKRPFWERRKQTKTQRPNHSNGYRTASRWRNGVSGVWTFAVQQAVATSVEVFKVLMLRMVCFYFGVKIKN